MKLPRPMGHLVSMVPRFELLPPSPALRTRPHAQFPFHKVSR
jgi:hypothetical protein